MATSRVVDAGPPPRVRTMVKLVRQSMKTSAVIPGNTVLIAGHSMSLKTDI